MENVDGWNIIVENKIREAIEQGKFDHLRGAGEPLDLARNPYEDALAPTFRRILRDNGATHPLIEARRAIEQEKEALRLTLQRAWRGFQQYASKLAWERATAAFRTRAGELNRHIYGNNLRAPLANFHVRPIDIDAEIASVTESHP
jgi:hypothetical protein